jgi:fatty acid desaturase
MKKQIVHISVHQTSKVVAAMRAAMTAALFVFPLSLGYWFQGHVVFGVILLLFIPVIFWLLLYIGYVIACWFYNLVIPWTGGIEVEVIEKPPSGHQANEREEQ